ncbi:hypothetical protein TSOC_007293 [Tetrabaena socialis]|uniref:Coenzyme Q-binding protein COQ10 START domain-containing protein n=1 Tax=Tetrabaena socialis TaxID=47790 RepID=A0A2J8A1C8_9CHLO|nr:hypothetical protein TSOC_007293 [Tetrabaena socialis]|eukprot:PNH06323.1 hypothetical protein TSOC_007293 [Tetrabaena socialis]
MGRRKPQHECDALGAEAAALAGAAGADRGALGAEDVRWAPLPASTSTTGEDKRRPVQPYELQQHTVKCHLKSATAELVSEEGPVRRWRLDYRARWKFWKVGGVCDNRLWMTTDREQGTVSFVLREPGFLRRYEGTWTITGPHGAGSAGPHASAASLSPAAAAAAITPAASALGAAPRRQLWRPLPGAGAAGGGSAPSSPRSASGSDASSLLPPRSLSATSTSSSTSSSASGSSRRFWDGGLRGSGGSGDATPDCSPLDTPRAAGAWRGGAAGLGSFLAAVNNPFTAAPPPLSQPSGSTAAAAAVRGGQAAGGMAAAASAAAAAAAAPAAPRWPTTILVHKSISPKVSPPFPINQVLKGHAAGQVNDMLEGLLAATARRLAEVEAEADA